MEYTNTYDDRIDMFVEYRPKAAKQRPEDFKQQILLEDEPITEAYIKEHNLYMGMTTTCVKRTLRYGDICYERDWLFPDLDKYRKGGLYGNTDDPEEHKHG